MKKQTLALLLFCASYTQAQDDFRQARVDNFIDGVYIFIECDPLHEYDPIDRIKMFEFGGDKKTLEKIIHKAQKKNKDFDGMIYKFGEKTVELVKFKERLSALGSFRMGDYVQYPYAGNTIRGEIIFLDYKKDRAVIEYIDHNGKKDLDRILIKNLRHWDGEEK